MEKRQSSFADGGPMPKRPKTGTGPASGAKMTFAERMMAKMGHKQGEGLGKEASGIVNPIEVKLRPQGAGVGVVKERTPQAKLEAKRVAERRGEHYEDSSEEERKARKKKKEAARNGSTGTPISTRPKQRYRTVAEIEAEDGLNVPSVFKSLIDRTGQQPKLLTSTAGLMTQQPLMLTSKENEASKVAKRARQELEAFADAWKDVQSRKTYLQLQEDRLKQDLQRNQLHEIRLTRLSSEVDSIALEEKTVLDLDTSGLVSKLEKLALEYAKDASSEDLMQLGVASILSRFRQAMADWDPLEQPNSYVSYIRPLKSIFVVNARQEESDIMAEAEINNRVRYTNVYESMMYLHWLPKVRTAIINDWNAQDPTPMLALLENWKDMLPRLVLDVVLNQLLVQKLSTALKAWRPHGSSNKKHQDAALPHHWLLPWFQHLDDYHFNAKSANGLLADVKRKYRAAFDTWDPSRGVIEGLERWFEITGLRNELKKDLEVRLLPRLAQHLQSKVQVDPSNEEATLQDVAAFEDVLKWSKFVKPDKFVRIFIDSFFPKWHRTLYLWLTSEPNYEEIGVWFEWWKSVFPEELNAVQAVAREWEKGLLTMNTAMELGPGRVKTELAPPVAPTPKVVPLVVKTATPSKSASHQDPETIKDILEELCEQDGLLFMQTHKAHPETGLPLFKISASAIGTGGITVYIRGDLVYAQNKRDRNIWEPVDIYADGLLLKLAEEK